SCIPAVIPAVSPAGDATLGERHRRYKTASFARCCWYGAARWRCIRKSATTERGNFILTLYEKRVAPEDLPFFIALMDHLAHHGVACPTPVRARDGEA